MEGVTLTIANVYTGEVSNRTVSDEKGEYVFREIPPGKYRMIIIVKDFIVHERVIQVGEGGLATDVYLWKEKIEKYVQRKRPSI